MSYSVRDYPYSYFRTLERWAPGISAYFSRDFQRYAFLPVRAGRSGGGVWISEGPIPTPPQTPIQAVAQANVNGSGRISSVTITNQGSGYLLEPAVTLIPPLPSTPATFPQVFVDPGGFLFEVAPFIANGWGYFDPGPYTVTIDPPPGPGIQATASVTVFNGSVQTFTLINPGTGYAPPPAAPPNIIVTPGPLASVQALFGATVSAGRVISVSVLDQGQNYNPFASPLVLTVGPPP